METKKKSYYPAIDGLRAYAAIGVVLVHVLQNSNYLLSGPVFEWLIPEFYNLPFLFMIISGFSMCCGYYEKVLRKELDLEQFYSKRFLRLWPLFALMSLVEFAVSPGMDTLQETLVNLTLLCGFTGKRMTIIGVGWYIGISIIFYMIFPFFCTLLSSRKKAWTAFGVTFLMNWLCIMYLNVSCNSFAYDFVYFVIGGLIYLYRQELTALAEKHRLLLALCIAATMGLHYYSYTNLPEIVTYILLRIVIYALCLIYALVPGRKLLDNPVTHFLSGISLEIYLCHMAVFRVFQKLGLTTPFGNGPLSYFVVSVAVTVCTVLVSMVVQKVLDIAVRKVQTHLQRRAA